MKFFIEIAPPTGEKNVQYIGILGDGTFVVDAETPEDAEDKLFNLLTVTMKSVETRLASDDEAEKFAEAQADMAASHEFVKKLTAGWDEQAS